jgi:UDP-galactopyranose mutase
VPIESEFILHLLIPVTTDGCVQPRYKIAFWSRNVDAMATQANSFKRDVVCFSHLRWDFVFQRPQHLLTRSAKQQRTFFIEEPIFGAEEDAAGRLNMRERDGVQVVTPHLKEGTPPQTVIDIQKALLDTLFIGMDIREPVLWYYTPMALPFSRHLPKSAVVYDCMDELSAFRGAPPALTMLERELFDMADVVFTGGQSLYESKKQQHQNVYLFPSSIERAHFAKARRAIEEPADQKHIPHPRLGFYGVIDERLDIELLDKVAQLRPNWHFVMIGPVVKIDPASLPRHANVHYLGQKSYQELPAYLATWDVAMMPFARNESTRYISPTKTPEYLAAGKPVVSTSIKDVVRSYGHLGLAYISNTPADFVAASEFAMRISQQPAYHQPWLRRVDEFLSTNSWDHTWERMSNLIASAIQARHEAEAPALNAGAIFDRASSLSSAATAQ